VAEGLTLRNSATSATGVAKRVHTCQSAQGLSAARIVSGGSSQDCGFGVLVSGGERQTLASARLRDCASVVAFLKEWRRVVRAAPGSVVETS